MDNSATMCYEVIESYNEDVEVKSYDETKTIPTNFNENKTTCKTQNVYILLEFLLITVALLIAVSIYCYLIKCRAKEKYLLPFQFTYNKLQEIIYQKYKSQMSNKSKIYRYKKPNILLFQFLIQIILK